MADETQKEPEPVMDLIATRRVFKALDEFLKAAERPMPLEEYAKKHKVMITNQTMVCCVEPKTTSAKAALWVFCERDNEFPEMSLHFKTGGKSKFSLEFFMQIMSIIKASGSETFTIRVENDYPAEIENEHFKFIIAPRVED